MMHVERILVPADGSAESEAAFAWACDLARDPGPDIVRLVDKHDINLVVMGSRGMGRVARWTLGSVSTYVLHRASCPVLTVKADAQA